MKYRKQYIDVDVAISASGQMLPRIIHWTDGRKYTISKVKAIVPSPALKAGGQGDRYTVMLENQERYLFFERPTDSDDASMVGRSLCLLLHPDQDVWQRPGNGYHALL